MGPGRRRPATGKEECMAKGQCRFCRAQLKTVFVDLGMSPLCQSHLEPEAADQGEEFFPLCAYICDRCLLVQIPDHVRPERIFSDYAYFSSYADTLLKHAEAYVAMAAERFSLGTG